tara:strand:+ start:1431 stop:1901 length:471 start_codon:yes stop_codon:yes gene_type:complete
MLSLRDAQESDCRLLWEWRNEEAVRKTAFSSDPISWEDHQKWFAGKLKDQNCHLYVAVDKSEGPFGQVRFDFTSQDEAEIHLSIVSPMRGRGRGRELIGAAVDRLFSSTTIGAVSAYIKPENAASIRAFEGEQFLRLGMIEKLGQQAFHMLKKRCP